MVKKKTGRPSKYDPSMCEDIIEFFSRPLYIKKKITKWVDGKEEIITIEEPNETPWLINWCIKHGISHDTPQNWAKEYPEFLGALYTAKKKQEAFLSELGIKGDHNAFMTFQALKNVSGWRDKQEIDHSGMVKNVNVDITDKSTDDLIRILVDGNSK